jgi:hypothetical protein
MVRKLLPDKGKGYKMQLKPLQGAQTLTAMIGYITKDQGKAHYKILVHNISAQVFNNLFLKGVLVEHK